MKIYRAVKKRINESSLKPVVVIVVLFAVISGVWIFSHGQKDLGSSDQCIGQENQEPYTKTQYESLTTKYDCYLCGDDSDRLLSWYWGEHNVAIIDLNSFDFFRIEINRYDEDKKIIEKKVGAMQLSSYTFRNGENLTYRIESDRGYAEGTIEPNDNDKLSLKDLVSYLCSDCLTEFMNQYIYSGEHWNFALLDLNDKTLKPLEKTVTGFGIGDFNFRYRYDKDKDIINFLVWYSPMRYK